MPKQKTNKSAAKRIKITASGKMKIRGAGKGHLLSSKSRSRKRRLKRARMLAKCEMVRLAPLLSVSRR